MFKAAANTKAHSRISNNMNTYDDLQIRMLDHKLRENRNKSTVFKKRSMFYLRP